ncbi:hypothetical protein ACTHPF_13175 [Paenibacillus sp. SAF-054]|uniref:hypothetical protein n=1 Tax=unclassified Paenibacillus TaxID=185978 RepID=UPI003F820FFB
MKVSIKYLVLIGITFVFLILLYRYWNDDSKPTPMEAIEQARTNTGMKVSLAEVDVENGIIVFYKQNQSINAEFVRKTRRGWKWGYGGGHTIPSYPNGVDTNKIDTYLSYQYFPGTDDTEFGSSPFPMLFGVLKNSNVSNIVVKDLVNNNEIKATIINGNQDYRIWYVFIDKDQDKKFIISTISDEGKVIADKTINEELDSQTGTESIK